MTASLGHGAVRVCGKINGFSSNGPLPGLDNSPADSLSRNALSLFTSQVPEASKLFPTAIVIPSQMVPFLRL